jgi:hypothetical protein
MEYMYDLENIHRQLDLLRYVHCTFCDLIVVITESS